MSEAPNPTQSWVMRLGAIGDRPGDSDAERLKHRLLVFMGVLMSGGGILWGSIAASQHLFLPAIIPYGYTVATAFNLTYFRRDCLGRLRHNLRFRGRLHLRGWLL